MTASMQKWETLTTLDKETDLLLDVNLLESLLDDKSIKPTSSSKSDLRRSQSVKTKPDLTSAKLKTGTTLPSAFHPLDFIKEASTGTNIDNIEKNDDDETPTDCDNLKAQTSGTHIMISYS